LKILSDMKTRKEGYYWTFGNKCFEVKRWSIYYWDGRYFWNGNEDFSEDSFEMIDETEIKRETKSQPFDENENKEIPPKSNIVSIRSEIYRKILDRK